MASYRIVEAANNGMGSAAIVGAATADLPYASCNHPGWLLQMFSILRPLFRRASTTTTSELTGHWALQLGERKRILNSRRDDPSCRFQFQEEEFLSLNGLTRWPTPGL